MSIDFSKVTALSDSYGNITQITDASGRVIWSGRELIQGSMILRPSADIYVGHALIPVDSTAAYLLINEETSDGSSTKIQTNNTASLYEAESKFVLTNVSQLEVSKYTVSSVNIYADSANYEGNSNESYNEFVLEINGVETSAYRATTMKNGINISVPDAIPLINEAIAVTGTLPSINIKIKSRAGEYVSSGMGGGSDKTRTEDADVTQVYVTLGYEGY